jgi:hypothetical protein
MSCLILDAPALIFDHTHSCIHVLSLLLSPPCVQAASKLTSIQSTFTTIQDQLLTIKGQLASNIDKGLTTLTDTAKKVVDPYNNLKGTYKQQAADGDNYRNLAMLIIFILPVLSLLAILIGGITKSGCPFTAYYWLGYLASFLIFLMFAIHLPFAVVLADGCAYVSTVDANFSSISQLSSGSPAPVRLIGHWLLHDFVFTQ